MVENRLYRSKSEKMIAGVCGGIAESYNYDPSLVRLAFLILTILTNGTLILVYLFAWILIPHESEI